MNETLVTIEVPGSLSAEDRERYARLAVHIKQVELTLQQRLPAVWRRRLKVELTRSRAALAAISSTDNKQ